MLGIASNKKGTIAQITVCVLAIVVVSALCFIANNALSYRSDALILMLTVSILAMLYDIWAVIVAAVLSALIWNFFFIPPLFTFHIETGEDALMFLMYFVIALLNAVLMTQIKKEQRKLRKKEEEAMAIKLYNTVLNSLSHELKTPIATIIGSVDMLEDKETKINAKQQEELLHEIGVAGQRLNRQINNLLQMSRLDSGMLQPKNDWVDLEELSYKLIYELKAESRIKLLPKTTIPYIKTDGYWLEIVLYNLLLNALNYATENTEIHLMLSCENDTTSIVVSDAGPGIDDIDKIRIFDKFYRVKSNAIEGSGLGLSIVKGYLEALGGKVIAADNSRGGTDFIVSLEVPTTFANQLNHD